MIRILTIWRTMKIEKKKKYFRSPKVFYIEGFSTSKEQRSSLRTRNCSSFMRPFSFFSRFLRLFYDRSRRDEWRTLDWSERSRLPEIRFSSVVAEIELARGSRICRDRGLKVKRPEEHDEFGCRQNCWLTRCKSNEFRHNAFSGVILSVCDWRRIVINGGHRDNLSK